MNRAIKIIIFAFLVITVFCVSAFASENTVEWDYGYEDSVREAYTYGGELNCGENKVSSDMKTDIFGSGYPVFDNVYYELDVEREGYYNINVISDNCIVYISQDVRNNVAYGDEEYFCIDEDGFKIHLEEGRCLFGIVFSSYDTGFFADDCEGRLDINFIAEEITDLQLDEACLEDIILGYHIGTEFDENNTGAIYAEGKIVFNNEEELEISEWLTVRYPENIARGENDITFLLPGYEKTYTVQIKTVDDYVKNIEIGNAEEAAVVRQTFLPDIAYPQGQEYFELILTMPDGTKRTEYTDCYYEIELESGGVLTLWCDYYLKDDGRWYLTVEVGNEEYLSIPCETVPASFSENLNLCCEGIAVSVVITLADMSFYFSEATDLFSGVSFEERVQYASEGFASVKDCLSDIYRLSSAFSDYYTAK